MAEIDLILETIGIILTGIAIIIVIWFNIKNIKKTDERLERTLRKDEITRNRRIQKIFNVIKKNINEIIFISEPSDRGNYKSYMISFEGNIESPFKIDLNQRRITETRAFLKSHSEDLKYFGIQSETPLSILHGRYVITHDKLEILKPYAPDDHKKIKQKIISEIKQYCKEFFDINLV